MEQRACACRYVVHWQLEKMKERLDIVMVANDLAPSREKARALIMSGVVFVNDVKVEKAGQLVDGCAHIEVRGKQNPYVSRGGLKLEKAMSLWKIDLTGKTALDIGASSGGFTDCMLAHGAKKVYSVDVGTNQLVYKLRMDTRVVCIEKTNFRSIPYERIGEQIDFFSEDVSFISVLKLCESLAQFCKPTTSGVVLIKPQFESERAQVGKGGVVRDAHVHRETVGKVIAGLEDFGWYTQALSYSPITGPKGNIEYLAYVSRACDSKYEPIDALVDRVVAESHQVLTSS